MWADRAFTREMLVMSVVGTKLPIRNVRAWVAMGIKGTTFAICSL